MIINVFLIVSIVSNIKNDSHAGRRNKDEDGYSFSALVRKCLDCFVRKHTLEDEEFLLEQEGFSFSCKGLKEKNLKNIPTEMLWEICYKLQPLDIMRLSLTSKKLTTKINEEFWKRYIKLHGHMKWDRSAPFVKVAYAFSLFAEGKIEQAARLGLPKAIEIIERKENEMKEKEWGRNPYLSSQSHSHSCAYGRNKYANPTYSKMGNGFRGY